MSPKDPQLGDEMVTDAAPDYLANSVPGEIVLEIGDHLCATDRWALMRTCRAVHDALEPLLWHRGPDCTRAGQHLRTRYRRMVQRCAVGDLFETSHAGALLWAIEHRDPKVASRALRFGAADERLVRRLLRPAVAYDGGCADILELFLAHLPDGKATVDAEIHPRPLLFDAAFFGSLPVFETLVRFGADPNTSWCGVPIIYSLRNDVGETAAELLMRHGADVLVAVNGRWPLTYAISQDKAYMLPILAGAGANLLASTPNGVLANELCYAVLTNAKRCVRVLVERGSDPLARGANGCNAVSTGRVDDDRLEIWRVFLDSGVPVDARHTGGMTMLMMAAQNRAVKLTRFLLERGADATLADDDGKTALQHACGPPVYRAGVNGLQPALLILDAAQMRAGRKARPYAFSDDRRPCWRSRRAALAQLDDDGNTALYWAVFAADKYLCKRLLRAGADPHAPAGDGRSLLSVAAAGSSPAIVRRLLRDFAHDNDDGGGGVNVQDADGRTPLSYAACNPDKTAMRATVRLLMAAGAGPSRRLRDRDGLRPMGWARKHGQELEFRDAVLTWRILEVGMTQITTCE